jgi:hypothetical protein
MLFGPKVKYCITYKAGAKSFDIYSRKYVQEFKSTICSENLEGSHGLDVSTMNQFLVTKKDTVHTYTSDTF